MNFLRRVINSLLPRGLAWTPEIDQGLDQFLDGQAENWQLVKSDADKVRYIRDPLNTPVLSDLEKEYGIIPNLDLTESERRSFLNSRAREDSPNGSDDALEDILRQAGFDVLAHRNDPAIDPSFFISDDDLIVNSDFFTQENLFSAVCGNEFIVCGNSRAVCGYKERSKYIPKTYEIPTDPNKFRFLSFVGGEKAEGLFDVNNTVRSIAVQSDGKTIIGGEFNQVDGIEKNFIARLNINRSLDNEFGKVISNFNNTVRSVAVQSDGKIVVGGLFTESDGTSRNYIARLNTDGSLDLTFDPGAGANNFIYSVAIQSDGKIITGGNFTIFDSTPRNRIARLNTDGSLDPAFDPGAGANGFIYSVSVQSDGKIIVGGNFTIFDGTPRNRIARLNTDGSHDLTFDPGTGANSQIRSVAIQGDGKIIISGFFTEFDGTSRNYIARLNTDGSLDPAFDPGTGANNFIVSVAIQGDGKIIAGGVFTQFDGTPRNRIARLNTDGSHDLTFDPGTGANSQINSVLIQSDGKIIIGGNFTIVNSTSRNYIARLNTDGSLNLTFDPGAGANNFIYSVAIQSDGKIITGGNFTIFDSTPRNRIARLNTDGSLIRAGANNFIYSVAIQSDGKIITGGNFTIFDSTPRNRIARLNTDGSLDPAFDPGAGANDFITSVAIQSDGKIIIGGNFTIFDGTSRNRIARLNTDGSLDPTFDPGAGISGFINSVAIQSDGKIITGGNFTIVDSTPRNRIARLNTDGSLDLTFDPGTGANGQIISIALQGDGKIIIGGLFTQFDGTSRNRIARLNTDGSLDPAFDPGAGANGFVYSVAIQGDGKIIIGGLFTQFDGTPRNRIARLNTDGSLDLTFDPGTGANNTIRSIAFEENGTILAGGLFTEFNSNPTFKYIVPLNILGSVESLVIKRVNISKNREQEFKSIILRIKPQHQWIGAVVNYV